MVHESLMRKIRGSMYVKDENFKKENTATRRRRFLFIGTVLIDLGCRGGAETPLVEEAYGFDADRGDSGHQSHGSCDHAPQDDYPAKHRTAVAHHNCLKMKP